MTTKEKRLAEGICIWCGKAPARENRQMCEQCAQRQRENVKNVRKTWKALHQCVQCGSPMRDAEGKIPMYKTKDGFREYATCEKCRKRARKYGKRQRMEKERD